MASHIEQAQYIPLSPLPLSRSDEAESSSPHLEPLSSETPYEVPADGYRSLPLSRRSSATSSVSVASSQARNQANRPLKQVFENITGLARTLESTATGRLRRSRYHGWRMGVLCGSFMSAFVLCCNIAIVISGSVISEGYQHDGTADLMYGGAFVHRSMEYHIPSSHQCRQHDSTCCQQLYYASDVLAYAT